MRVFPESTGEMKDWPQVSALPGAVETLAGLHPQYLLAVATNAKDSDETAIWAALERVGLAEHLDRVYCYRNIGYAKPDRRFFDHIIADLLLPLAQIIMVGDDWDSDIRGANLAGLRAVWLNEGVFRDQHSEQVRTVHTLAELPTALEDW
jgi:HAD superfamily hydrolase (TIGR01509 family)